MALAAAGEEEAHVPTLLQGDHAPVGALRGVLEGAVGEELAPRQVARVDAEWKRGDDLSMTVAPTGERMARSLEPTMPTILRAGPYRIYFYSHEPNEPPHVHVDRDAQSAKFWLDPVALARNLGFGAKELGRIERVVAENESRCLEVCVSTSERSPGERVKDVRVTQDVLCVDLMDGRTISVPLAWYPRLLHATAEQRSNWEICGGGFGIHWPYIDEDLSTEGLLRGAPAPHQRRATGT